MTVIQENRIRRIQSRESLIAFLRDDLSWPAPPDLAAQDMFYDYTADELSLDGQAAEQVRVQQLANFGASQPWGVFLLETATPRLYTTHLRRILRGLVPAARRQHSSLPAWPAANLLFIATHNYRQFTFTHFDGERAANSRLSAFGWDNVDAGVRTLCEHNLPALAWPEDEADAGGWLAQWSSAFDVEAVTDKFFREFRDLFEDLKAALPRTIQSPAARHAFTQRLLNRLLFLCFLQKKRWLRAPNLPHPKTTYLFDLYQNARAEGEEFYAEYLHDLFFKALNRPPVKGAERLRDPIALKLGCVPFLNGGLFDPADALDARDAVRLPNRLFEPILGHDGLLRRYNFTVTESTPLNQEVAVDPEMLGKVFETVVLTSEGAEDYQAPNLRKATGSFYTPRIVVTFIVREVLKDYLTARVTGLSKAQLTNLMEIDAAGGLSAEAREQLRKAVSQQQAEAIRAQLRTLRACDPAVGSGAFALGLLHELVNLNILCETIERGKDPRLANPNLAFELKKRIIERSIYGVDLQAKAVEICKLRLWLSLIVDYETGADLETCTEHQFERAIDGIPALPNLSYKIRRGDSLLDLVHGRPFRLKEMAHDERMQDARAALEDTQRRFFSEEDTHEKRRLRRDALVHRTRLTRLQLEGQRQALQNAGPQLSLLDGKGTRAAIRQHEAALAEIDTVLAEVAKTEGALEPLRAKQTLSDEDDYLLTRLEAAGEGEEITFSWELDFPEVFTLAEESGSTVRGAMQGIVNQTPGQMELPVRELRRGGFDIVVGNPPFVTARNREKREAYAERWRESCHKNYQLVAPFFQRSFGLLRSGGQLGLIVSNAFSKREFGQPVVEKFLPTVELYKVIDCSGLSFPGHGTPTCIVFARNLMPQRTSAIRVAATLPGGGDLRTAPENSPVWIALQTHHDHPGYDDGRVAVADHPRTQLAVWPWSFDLGNEPTRQAIESTRNIRLREKTDQPIGHIAITRTDEVFIVPEHLARRVGIETTHLRPLGVGEKIRDWAALGFLLIVFPYDGSLRPASVRLAPKCIEYLRPFRSVLENVVMHGSVRKRETNVRWFEYSRLARAKLQTPLSIVLPEIATHNHALVTGEPLLFHQTVPVVKLRGNVPLDEHYLIAGLLNSSSVLFWLKLVCFNKGAGDEEERDRFVYAGGKIEQIPMPSVLFAANSLRGDLISRARSCSERGRQLPRLAFRKLFEIDQEAYSEWYSSLPGYVRRHECLIPCRFSAAKELITLRDAALAERQRLRSEMIALQEEMDWLIYAAYGLLPLDHPAVGLDGQPELPEPLALGERPFELLRDGKAIPPHFSPARRALWEARLKAIAENEHIRRIEQPVYKRRWYRKETDEQEFRRAFEWWLLEKTEWWLEHKAAGGPVALETWAAALWEDERIRAAVEVVEPGSASPDAFPRLLRSIVVDTTVPDWIPPAMPWEQVEKRFKGKKVPARAKRIRGRLNVPRERFRLTADGEYVWAGKELGLRGRRGRG